MRDETVAASPRCRNADSLHARTGQETTLDVTWLAGRERREGVRCHCHTLSHHSPLQFIRAPCPPAALGFPGAGAGSLCHGLSLSAQHAALGLERVQLGSLHPPVSI